MGKDSSPPLGKPLFLSPLSSCPPPVYNNTAAAQELSLKTAGVRKDPWGVWDTEDRVRDGLFPFLPLISLSQPSFVLFALLGLCLPNRFVGRFLRSRLL